MNLRLSIILGFGIFALCGCTGSDSAHTEKTIPQVRGVYKNPFSVLKFDGGGGLVVRSPSGDSYGSYEQRGRSVFLLNEKREITNTLDVDLKTGDLTERGLTFWRRNKS